MKFLYKFVALLAVFGLSIFIFGKGIPTITVGSATASSLHDSTFPIMYLQLDKYTVNTLHGYSGELGSGQVRESITPINSSKSFTVKIAENESKIKKLDYELRDINNNKVISTNTLTAFDSKNSYKTAKLKMDVALDTSREYGLEITLTTNYSKKIHFYTRIKYYESDYFLKEKINFVKNFHNATFNNGKSLNIENYLEPSSEKDTTLGKVTIKSSYKMVTWANLNPKKITAPVPTIKELNIETAAIEQDYYVKANTPSGTETYHVTEFYRVRYTSDRIYLLYFQRTMEAVFDPALTSLTKGEFKIGISDTQDFNLTSSSDNNQIAFVRNGSLWYYNLKKNNLNQVFSFSQNSKDYLRDDFDQHDIKILKMDKKGNISFIVYGYMNCGDYEGRVGILLYDYSPKSNQITERVYIPLSTTYQQLKEDFGDFCYVNDKNIFYFSLASKVFAYNISSKRYDVLTKNASNDNFAMLESAKCFVWSNATPKKQATHITILDLETEKKETVSTSKNQSIKVLGTIDSNIVYGYIKNSDIYQSADGNVITPIYKLIISDCKGNILKVYKRNSVYVTHAKVSGNVIRLSRIKKSNGSFHKISDDSVMNQKITDKKSIGVTTRVTKKALTEKYISLPAGFVMTALPNVQATKYVMVTENTTLHLQDESPSSTIYYVYAYGGITASLSNAGDAILLADEQQGVVMDSDSHIVWERGGKFTSKTLSGITLKRTGNGVSSIKACSQMLLQAAQVTVNTSQLKGSSIMSILNKYLKTPVNLTGCTVDQVLYFVSNEKPVIAMKDSSSAVLITEYTPSTVSWYDPATGITNRQSLSNAESYFENAGYVFISYINN